MARVEGIDPNKSSRFSDALYAELRRYFPEEQLIELAADAAQKHGRARWSRVFDVDSDAPYRVIPAALNRPARRAAARAARR